ncbi:hypothetical protein MKZ38_004509 [Zalerion maritima]|uniref:Uncharacterized protein n=1 Tax=Zalerion maritima TaxID=339359 RepID=A0AAD5RLH1_9PEZI|nr:hypothetical protein MKZ38_004509 [Zalerion maritima]
MNATLGMVPDWLVTVQASRIQPMIRACQECGGGMLVTKEALRSVRGSKPDAGKRTTTERTNRRMLHKRKEERLVASVLQVQEPCRACRPVIPSTQPLNGASGKFTKHATDMQVHRPDIKPGRAEPISSGKANKLDASPEPVPKFAALLGDSFSSRHA